MLFKSVFTVALASSSVLAAPVFRRSLYTNAINAELATRGATEPKTVEIKGVEVPLINPNQKAPILGDPSVTGLPKVTNEQLKKLEGLPVEKQQELVVSYLKAFQAKVNQVAAETDGLELPEGAEKMITDPNVHVDTRLENSKKVKDSNGVVYNDINGLSAKAQAAFTEIWKDPAATERVTKKFLQALTNNPEGKDVILVLQEIALADLAEHGKSSTIKKVTARSLDLQVYQPTHHQKRFIGLITGLLGLLPAVAPVLNKIVPVAGKILTGLTGGLLGGGSGGGLLGRAEVTALEAASKDIDHALKSIEARGLHAYMKDLEARSTPITELD